MTLKKLIAVALVFASVATFATERCKTGEGLSTPYGRLVETRCIDGKGLPLRHFVALDGRKLIEDASLYEQLTPDKSRAYWIYVGGIGVDTYCPRDIYMLDLSIRPPTTIAFGVQIACNEFQWVSWGNNGGVIALKNDIRFRYKAGVMTPPRVDEKFIRDIELPENASHESIDIDRFQPFVRLVVLPESGALAK